MNRYFEALKTVFRSFSIRDQAAILGLALLIVGGILGLASILNNRLLVPVAAAGGSGSHAVRRSEVCLRAIFDNQDAIAHCRFDGFNIDR